MRKISTYIFLFITAIVIISFTSCSNRPKNVLSKGNMEDLLYDYHLARSMSDTLSQDQLYKQDYYIKGVLKKYNISQADFDSSMVWYSRHVEDMSDIYQNIQDRLKADVEKLNRQIAESQLTPTGAASGDSLDIWSFARSIRLSDDDLHNKLSFSITPDSTFHSRDVFEWTVDYISTNIPDMAHSPVMVLSVKYENDSTVTRSIMLSGSGNRSLRVQNIYEIPIRKVNGFIFLPKGGHTAMVVRTKSLMRYHAHGTPPPMEQPQNNHPGIPTIMPGQSPGQPASQPGTKPDTSKVAPSPYPSGRPTPDDLKKRQVDMSKPRGYQLRQQALEKATLKNKKKLPTPPNTTK